MKDNSEATKDDKTASVPAVGCETTGYVSLCDNCANKRNTWSDKLRDDGYIGCCLLLLDLRTPPDIEGIEAETLATGWINIGGRCFNDMVITRGTTKCPYYT
jgi:hypothetical protein